jgi:hypothetical protein
VVSPVEMPVDGTLNWTDANAMCPSRDTWPGVVYGLVTAVTCAARRSGTRAWPTWDLTAAEVTGAVDRMASVSVSPDRCGKCWSRIACPGSEPVKLLSAAAPNCSHSTTRQATPAIQAARVSQR